MCVSATVRCAMLRKRDGVLCVTAMARFSERDIANSNGPIWTPYYDIVELKGRKCKIRLSKLFFCKLLK